MLTNLSAVASFATACRSLNSSAFAIGRAADHHLSLDPDAVNWATAEHAQRLARQAEALAAELRAFGGAR
jgi:hypothetical protein